MKRKGIWVIVSVLVVVGLLIGGFGCAAPTPAPTPTPTPAPAPGPPEMTLRISSPYPEGALLTVHAKYFAERVTELTGGRITFETFWGGTLVGAGPVVLDSTSAGVVDISVGLWIYAPGKIPLGSFEYSFLFNDPDLRTQSRIKREMFERLPSLNGELAKFNIGPSLVFGTITSYDITSKMPITTLEDLKGLRVAHTPVEYVPVYEAAGAVSVISPAPEFYERLERGVVDAASLPLELLHLFKTQEVAKHHTTVGLSTPVTMTLWINMDTWNSLIPRDQELFKNVGKEADEAYISATEIAIEKARVGFAEAGVTFHTMPKSEIEKWTALMPDIVADWANAREAEGLPGWEVVDLYKALSAEAGWTFPREWGVR